MRNHFKRVTKLVVPVCAIYGGEVFPDSTLSLAAPREDKLILTVSGDVPAGDDVIAVSYTLDSYLHTFEAETLRVSADQDRSVTLITTSLPDRVARVERRRFPRAACSDQEAVAVYSFFKEGAPFAGTAIDIGARGASFGMPRGAALFRVGDSFPIVVVFPRFRELRLNAVVRAVTHAPDGWRVGVEFQDLSEEDAETIRQYVHLRQIQIDCERPPTDKTLPSRKSIFVIAAKDRTGKKHLVLCTDSFLSHLTGHEAFSEIASVDVIDYLEKA